MTRIQAEDQENVQDTFEPLTAEQVAELRKHQPLLSVWRVVGVQAVLGLLLAGLVWLVIISGWRAPSQKMSPWVASAAAAHEAASLRSNSARWV